MAIPQEPTTKTMEEWLRAAISRTLEGIAEEELARAWERIEKRKGEIIAGVVLDLSKHVELQTLHDTIVIRVGRADVRQEEKKN